MLTLLYTYEINQMCYSITSIPKLDSAKLFVLVTLVYSKLKQILFIQMVKYYLRCVPSTDRSLKAIKDCVNLPIEKQKNEIRTRERERERGAENKLQGRKRKGVGFTICDTPVFGFVFQSLCDELEAQQKIKKKLCEVVAKRKKYK